MVIIFFDNSAWNIVMYFIILDIVIGKKKGYLGLDT
jgi:hypothetical protein